MPTIRSGSIVCIFFQSILFVSEGAKEDSSVFGNLCVDGKGLYLKNEPFRSEKGKIYTYILRAARFRRSNLTCGLR